MKKLPSSLIIYGRKIPVKYLSAKKMLELYPQYQMPPQGLWDSSERTIYINKENTIKDQRYTLLHEIAHCANTFVGLDLIIDPSLQEVIVQTMATLMEDILEQSSKLK